VCARLLSNAARPPPQAGQTKPSGQRRSNRNAAQLVSSGKLAWNSLRDRALATTSPLAAAGCGRPRGHYTTYGATWDSGRSHLRTITYIEFIRRAAAPETIRWLEPLRKILVRAWHTTQKQHLLQYLIVLHALIDTLDKEHLVTRDRPTISNKLSRRSWRDLNYRVFGVYLRFVVDRQKYLGLPR